MRALHWTDQLLGHVDRSLKTLTGTLPVANSFEYDRRDTAEQGRLDLGRVHGRDRQNRLSDQFANFLSQSAEGQGGSGLVGAIVDEEDTGTGHGG